MLIKLSAYLLDCIYRSVYTKIIQKQNQTPVSNVNNQKPTHKNHDVRHFNDWMVNHSKVKTIAFYVHVQQHDFRHTTTWNKNKFSEGMSFLRRTGKSSARPNFHSALFQSFSRSSIHFVRHDAKVVQPQDAIVIEFIRNYAILIESLKTAIDLCQLCTRRTWQEANKSNPLFILSTLRRHLSRRNNFPLWHRNHSESIMQFARLCT